METYVMKQKVDSSKQVVLDLSNWHEGDEVELIVVVNSLAKQDSPPPTIFDMEQWAKQWECDLGEEIQSTDVTGFTGRRF